MHYIICEWTKPLKQVRHILILKQDVSMRSCPCTYFTNHQRTNMYGIFIQYMIHHQYVQCFSNITGSLWHPWSTIIAIRTNTWSTFKPPLQMRNTFASHSSPCMIPNQKRGLFFSVASRQAPDKVETIKINYWNKKCLLLTTLFKKTIECTDACTFSSLIYHFLSGPTPEKPSP